MKTSQRHSLKTNELAASIERARVAYESNQRSILWALVGAVALVAVIGGILVWRSQQAAASDSMLARAVAVSEAPVVPPSPSAAPGQPQPPAPPAGSFQNEQARADAAVTALMGVASQYPGSQAGLAARYQAAGLLAAQGKRADAEREFKAVVDSDGRGLYGRMAQLGLAELQLQAGQFEPAIATFRDFSTRADGDLPVDAILMQLGRAYRLAGKSQEALQTFVRVSEEFPQSLYAAEARREADAIKHGASGKAS